MAGPPPATQDAPEAAVKGVLGLIREYGWPVIIAILFGSLYFGWLPDPRRTAAEKLVASITAEMNGLRMEARRNGERTLRALGMMTELCLTLQRHDPKSTGSCSYVYQNHSEGGGGP